MSTPLSFGQSENSYKLSPEDVIHITVYEQGDLETRTRIPSSGVIAFPLIGDIQASGLTASELEEKIRALLQADYLVHPQVSVFIEAYHAKQVSVLGDVQNPGKYDLHTERPTTVLEAIAMAGGFNDTAKLDGTHIIRKENGVEKHINIEVKEITKKGKKEKDIPLNPGDIIYVPESFF